MTHIKSSISLVTMMDNKTATDTIFVKIGNSHLHPRGQWSVALNTNIAQIPAMSMTPLTLCRQAFSPMPVSRVLMPDVMLENPRGIEGSIRYES
jgi:hypothetical protein